MLERVYLRWDITTRNIHSSPLAHIRTRRERDRDGVDAHTNPIAITLLAAGLGDDHGDRRNRLPAARIVRAKKIAAG